MGRVKVEGSSASLSIKEQMKETAHGLQNWALDC